MNVQSMQVILSAIALGFSVFGTLAIWLLNGIKSELKELKTELKENKQNQDKLKEENYLLKSDFRALQIELSKLSCVKDINYCVKN